MLKITNTVLGFAIAMTIGMPGKAEAVMQAETVYQCTTAYTSAADGVDVPTTLCYTTYNFYNDNSGWVGTGGSADYVGEESGSDTDLLAYAANPNDNPNAATCHSDVTDRYNHAIVDANKTLAIRRYGANKVNVGDVLTIIYDDNGTEQWIVSSTMSTSSLNPIPKAGTLKCP